MSAFLISSASLALVAAAFVLTALLRGGRVRRDADRRAANVALYRERVAELDDQLGKHEIDATEHEALAAEAAAALLEDAAAQAPAAGGVAVPAPAGGAKPYKVAVLVAAAAIAIAVFIYRDIGGIDLVHLDRDRELLNVAPSEGDGSAANSLADWAARLEAHLAKAPDDTKSWYLLGHARMRQGNYPAAASAFEAVSHQAPDDAGVIAALAHARYLADDGKISDSNRALMNRGLALEPGEPMIRELLALDAFRSGRFTEAVTHLETALAGGVGGARAEALKKALERARAAGGLPAPAGVDVAVALGPLGTELQPGGALFVFARRPGERMPLLVARATPQVPVTQVRLDASNAMQPGSLPTAGENLELVARYSPSGRVGDEPGAREARTELVWGSGAVALAFDGAALAEVAAPVRTAAASAPSASAPVAAGAGLAIRIALAPGTVVPDGARVFVIAREIGGPPMPVAVRPIDPASLPTEIRLGDSDAMQPSRVPSQFPKLEVLARLSRSGNAMRQPGDPESAPVRVTAGAAEPVALVIGG